MRSLRALTFLALSTASACGRHGAAPPVTQPQTPALVAAGGDAPRAPGGPWVPHPVLDDPRLAVVAAAVRAGDAAGAATAMANAVASLAPGAAERPWWLYRLGRLQATAKDDDGAYLSFREASSSSWVLTPYASYAAAQAASRTGKAGDVLAVLGGVAGGNLPIGPSAMLLAADADERTGAQAAAIALWRSYLTLPRAPRWAEASVRAARALIGGSPSHDAALEAARLVHRVRVEAPSGAFATEAAEIEGHALAVLGPAERASVMSLGPGERLTRLQALADGMHFKEASAGLRDLEASLSAEQRGGDLGCRVAMLTGQVKGKEKDRAGAADAYDLAVARCAGKQHAPALYQAGKALAAAGQPREAMVRFAQVEHDDPRHRLADDARVHGAEAALETGDVARFTSMLETIADDYPTGDVITDGLFRLARYRIDHGDWAGAIAPLSTSERVRPRERAYYAAGRAPYFRARALIETGERERGLALLREVVRDYPLGYYMQLAYARLAEADAAGAAKVLASSAAEAPAGEAAMAGDDPLVHTDAFLRARALLDEGEGELALGEATLAARASTGDHAGDASPLDGLPVEVVRAMATMFAQAGAIAQASALQRGRVLDWLEHYPSGRWQAPWQLAYPRPFFEIVAREAQKSGIAPSLAYAIMREESAFDPNAVSPFRAYGLMQLIVPTAKTLAKRVGVVANEESLRQPGVNIALGCRYLGDLRAQFPTCPALAVPSYNAGPGAPKRWLNRRTSDDLDLFVERIPYDETRNYTKRVLTSYAAYLYLYEPALLDDVLRLPVRFGMPPPTPNSPADANAPSASLDDETPSDGEFALSSGAGAASCELGPPPGSPAAP